MLRIYRHKSQQTALPRHTHVLLIAVGLLICKMSGNFFHMKFLIMIVQM